MRKLTKADFDRLREVYNQAQANYTYLIKWSKRDNALTAHGFLTKSGKITEAGIAQLTQS